MKKLKVIISVFILSFALRLAGVGATSYLDLKNVAVPAYQGIYSSQAVIREGGPCALYMVSAIDNMSGDTRGVRARVVQKITPTYQSLWSPALTPDTTYNFTMDTNGTGIPFGGPQLELQATRWLMSKATFNGTFIY